MRIATLLLLLFCLGACKSSSVRPSYPVSIVSDELPDVFLAELPGVRAKRYISDASQRTGSYRVDLPPAWKGSSSASPGKALEIFVLGGVLKIGDLDLKAGGYAYLPPGNLGFNLEAYDGARLLYRIADVPSGAMIRTPILLDSELLGWEDTGIPGLQTKELRQDPGSGAKTWLQKVEPGTSLPWELSLAGREGYLLTGAATHSECVSGVVVTDSYKVGDYFYRFADAINGGPESVAETTSIWFLREEASIGTHIASGCGK